MIFSISFIIAMVADCLAVLVALYFILTDFSLHGPFAESSGRGLSYMTLGMCAWVALCYFLYTYNIKGLATILAWIPATPLLGYAAIVVLMMILKPDFK